MEFDWTQGALAEGLRRYDVGEFFAAHEAWETVWLEAHEPDKTFLQGLIQVTAAFHHLQGNNPLGAGRLLHAALRRLELYPASFGGISVTVLCSDIRERMQALNANEPTPELARARILPAVSTQRATERVLGGKNRYHRRGERKPMSPTEPAIRQHAFTGPVLPQLPEPTHAERVRTLVSLVSVATLSTISRKHVGFPFGSLMPFALDSSGRPIFLISNMAMHTQNLKADSRCSLFVGQAGADGDALGAARATLIGNAEPVPENDVAGVREKYLSRHENSRYWVDFSDFSFFRLQPIDLYYVGGFGVMGWVEARDYEHAAADPLAEAAPGILAHMNADHVDAMILLAESHAGIEATEATMTSVDRLGFSLRLKINDGVKGARINFLREVATPQDTRAVLVEMVRQAKARG